MFEFESQKEAEESSGVVLEDLGTLASPLKNGVRTSAVATLVMWKKRRGLGWYGYRFISGVGTSYRGS